MIVMQAKAKKIYNNDSCLASIVAYKSFAAADTRVTNTCCTCAWLGRLVALLSSP
jgi:hypothetical protein